MAGQPAIDRLLMDRLGELARLRPSADQEPLLRERLARILAAFQALQDLPTCPAGADASLPLPLREDVATPPLPVETVLANAPRQAASSFVVPRVVEA